MTYFGAVLSQKMTFLVILQINTFMDLGRSMKRGAIMVEGLLIKIGRGHTLDVTALTYYWAILSPNWSKRTILEVFANKTSFSFRLKHETLYNYGLGNSYRNWKGTQAVGHPYDLFLGHFKPYQLDIN